MNSKKAIAAAIAQAQAGVDYSPKTGANCPCCKAPQLPVRTTRKWDGPTRTRFHVCQNQRCLICSLGIQVKSIEVDTTQPPATAAANQNARA